MQVYRYQILLGYRYTDTKYYWDTDIQIQIPNTTGIQVYRYRYQILLGIQVYRYRYQILLGYRYTDTDTRYFWDTGIQIQIPNTSWIQVYRYRYQILLRYTHF